LWGGTPKGGRTDPGKHSIEFRNKSRSYRGGLSRHKEKSRGQFNNEKELTQLGDLYLSQRRKRDVGRDQSSAGSQGGEKKIRGRYKHGWNGSQKQQKHGAQYTYAKQRAEGNRMECRKRGIFGQGGLKQVGKRERHLIGGRPSSKARLLHSGSRVSGSGVLVTIPLGRWRRASQEEFLEWQSQ